MTKKKEASPTPKKPLPNPQGAKKPTCTHLHLVPYTTVPGRYNRGSYIVWRDIKCSDAHILRVVEYYCPACEKVITPIIKCIDCHMCKKDFEYGSKNPSNLMCRILKIKVTGKSVPRNCPKKGT